MTIVTRWDTAINTDYVRQFVVRQTRTVANPNRAFALYAEFSNGDEALVCEGTRAKCRTILEDILVRMTLPGEQSYYIET